VPLINCFSYFDSQFFLTALTQGVWKIYSKPYLQLFLDSSGRGKKRQFPSHDSKLNREVERIISCSIPFHEFETIQIRKTNIITSLSIKENIIAFLFKANSETYTLILLEPLELTNHKSFTLKSK
jgi:hypothetical protein